MGVNPKYLQVLGWPSKCAHWHSYCAAGPCVQTLLWSGFFRFFWEGLCKMQSCRSTVHHLNWKSALATICLKRNIFKEGSGSNSRFRRRLAEQDHTDSPRDVRVRKHQKVASSKELSFFGTFGERILVPSYSMIPASLRLFCFVSAQVASAHKRNLASRCAALFEHRACMQVPWTLSHPPHPSHQPHEWRSIEHVCRFHERNHSDVASSMCASSMNSITPTPRIPPTAPTPWNVRFPIR